MNIEEARYKLQQIAASIDPDTLWAISEAWKPDLRNMYRLYLKTPQTAAEFGWFIGESWEDAFAKLTACLASPVPDRFPLFQGAVLVSPLEDPRD